MKDQGPKRRGRAARAAARQGCQSAPVPQPRRHIPAYTPVSDATLDQISEQSDWILETIGLELRDDPVAIQLFQKAGAVLADGALRFPKGLLQEICKTVPATFQLHARDPAFSVTLGDYHLVLMPGYGSPFVTDRINGRRYATLDDFNAFLKLGWSTPYLQHAGGVVVEPTDIPVTKRHLDMVYGHLTLGAKPFMGAVTAPERSEDSLAMAEIVFGSEAMQKGAVIQANINGNSPLTYDVIMTDALRRYAAAGQCVCVSPAVFGGAMGPLTPAAIAAQTHAEVLVGIALTQLVRPGCPVIYGSFHNTMSLKSGALTFGTPEANLATFALAGLARRMNIPFRSGGGSVTGSNTADGQAMAESTAALWSTVLSGTHQVWHAAGWLEGGLTMGFEKYVMDLDNCGALLKMIGGLSATEEDLARDSYFEAGIGQTFLSTDHTMAHFETANFAGDIAEAGPFETWQEAGSQSQQTRATARWQQMLEDYQPPPMESRIKGELQDFVAKRRAELPDEWY